MLQRGKEKKRKSTFGWYVLCVLFAGTFMSQEKETSSLGSGSTDFKSFIQTNDNGLSDKLDIDSLVDYHTSDPFPKSLPSSSSKTYAVIHMGPHKTGTTTVQSLTGQFMRKS